MCCLEVRLLGPPTVRWQNAFVAFPRRRVRALLYRLALETKPVSREHLTALLWSDANNASAHRDLSHLLTHLRDALPDPAGLEVEADFVCLDRQYVWSDTAAFLELFHHQHPSTVDLDALFPPTHPTSDTILIEAASLYGGALMDGFYLDDGCDFEEWLTVERAIWERRFQKIFMTLEKSGIATDDIAVQMEMLRFAADQGVPEQAEDA